MLRSMTTEELAFAEAPTLAGKQIVLRPVAVADAPGLVKLLYDPEVRRLTGTHGSVRPGVLERAEQHYGSRADHDDELNLAIVDQETGDFLGEAVLDKLDAHNRCCNFRIALVGPEAFGRGYGAEATRLILAHAFETVGLNRVELQVYAFNPRARRVYERTGFVHEGTKRQALHWDGEWVDAEIMAILAEDWVRRQDRPEHAE